MIREDIEIELAQAEISVALAIANVERQRQMLQYATRIGAPKITKLATMLLGKVEDNLLLKMEIRDRLKHFNSVAIATERPKMALGPGVRRLGRELLP
jgi:hypothetical protein